MDHEPLVVPAHGLSDVVEPLRSGRLLGPHRVVELQEQGVDLGDQLVLVVARVADDGPAVRVADQVRSPLAEAGGRLVGPEVERAVIGVLVEVGLVVWTAAVEAVQVEPRRAEVDLGARVEHALGDRRRVERQVVVDELAEIGVAAGDGDVLVLGFGFGERRTCVGVHHRPGERDQRSLRPRKSVLGVRPVDRDLQLGKQPIELATRQGVLVEVADCARTEAVTSRHSVSFR